MRNPDKKRRGDAAYRERNRAEIRARHAAWRAAHPLSPGEAQLKHLYGISHDDYNDMFARQGGQCAICMRGSPGAGRRTRFCVDHDHSADTVRGLLCHACNSGIGLFGDNPALLRAAVEYLERHALVATATRAPALRSEQLRLFPK